MTEQHACEWVYAPDWKGGNIFACIYPDCENKLSYRQTSQRLNEYETLKKATEEALRESSILKGVLLAQECGQRSIDWWLENCEPEEGYANILEGK